MQRPQAKLPGGSFAPPLSDDRIAEYELLAEEASPEVKDAMQTLLKCVKHWWDLPESSQAGAKPHPSGRGRIVSLDEPIAKALWDDIPWTRELKSMGELFDGISAETQRELRNAAFHLLWHAVELDLDREPITADKV
jgi:hypothetical protein